MMSVEQADVRVVLVTVSSEDEATKVARGLVEQKLAACVNVIPRIESIYRWQGRIETDAEQLLLIKTTQARVDDLRERLMARHPYEVPEFVVIEPEAMSDAYRAWLVESVG